LAREGSRPADRRLEPVRELAALLAALLGPLLAAACSRESAVGTTTVEFWALGREGEVVRELVPEFERSHSDLRVRVQQIPWSAAHEKLLTAFAGGALPDALQVGSTWIAELVAIGALEPLDERVRASRAVRTDDYFAGVLDTAVIEGRTWAVPWYADTRLLFHRVDLFEAAGWPQPPRTWAEWREALADLRATLPAGAHPILLPLTEWEVPVILALQRGAELLRDGDRYGNFQSPAFRAAFDFYLSHFRDGFAPPRGAAEVGNLYQDFAAGTFACLVSGPWNLGELARRLPEELQDRWATAPLPAPEGEPPGLSLAGGASLALVRGSPRADAAWRWIEFLSEPERQVAFHRLSGDLPARRSAWRDARLAESPRARAFLAQLERVRATPKVPEWERIASRIARHAEAAVRGSESPEAALAALDRDADQVLEKRRWLLERAARSHAASGGEGGRLRCASILAGRRPAKSRPARASLACGSPCGRLAAVAWPRRASWLPPCWPWPSSSSSPSPPPSH
jgi:multiple sugar transport system substrate-binding protein